MITLKEWMELVDYKITEGSDYYSDNKILYSLDSWNGDQNGYSMCVIFDTATQTVFAVEAHDYKNNRAYRRAIPEFEGDAEAWDGVNFVDLESDDDFIQKALAIKNDEVYDTRVVIPLDLPESELLTLMTMAHERDMTFNDFVAEVIEKFVARQLETCVTITKAS
jgi:hypothetical protein